MAGFEESYVERMFVCSASEWEKRMQARQRSSRGSLNHNIAGTVFSGAVLTECASSKFFRSRGLILPPTLSDEDDMQFDTEEAFFLTKMRLPESAIQRVRQLSQSRKTSPFYDDHTAGSRSMA